MHGQAYDFVNLATQKNKVPDGLVVEIGGRNINGTIRGLFGKRKYVSIDLATGPGVDAVADGATYEPPEPAGVVVCCEVLEHAANADAICANACRMLKPGGMFIVTAAAEGRGPHSGTDGGRLLPGEFYRNVAEQDLNGWLEAAGFGEWSVARDDGPKDIYAIAWKARK